MQEIERLGSYLTVDEMGYIVKQASIDKIPEKWKIVIEETVSAYKQHFGAHLLSVYVRGSVARGQAIDGVSDLDTIAVVDPSIETDVSWGRAFSQQMEKKYPFVEKVEIVAETYEQALDRNRSAHIMLKTQAVCVYGKEISQEIPNLRSGKESCHHFKSLQTDLQKSIEFFENKWGTSQQQNERQCQWIMRRILRTGFELVMEREQKYTRDLYPCYESFAKYYPEKQKLMFRTLDLAVNPPIEEVQKILTALREWLEWMPGEIESVFTVRE